MSEVLLIAVGLVVGVGVALLVVALLRRRVTELDRQRREELSATIEQRWTSFAALSREALSANAQDFLRLAQTRLEKQTSEGEQSLETKKKLIDARLQEMGVKLADLNRLIQQLENQRRESHGSLQAHLEKATQVTNRLSDTTAQLREALANPQRRGQWGERMAEDVLRLAGFVEGINYHKQQSSADGRRPDFTFPLPDNRRLNMDVKFPLANYLKVLDAPDDNARQAATNQFLRDVRARIKDVTTRDYIDPAGGTVDYVLVFIPNEQVYGFIHEQDSALLDDAMRNRVVLCSPMTLYAILAVIRQSAENFRLEQGARQILDLLGEFKKQWGKYTDEMRKLGDRLEAAMKSYEEITGVRTRQLDRQLDKIELLQSTQGEQQPHLLESPESASRST